MTKHYGGVRDDSDDSGNAAYKALLIGGRSGFNALLGGGRSDDGEYARLKAHGFYWTASESNPATAWFYTLAKARCLSIGITVARSRWHFPCVVSGSDG